jgi:hypothetical protein
MCINMDADDSHLNFAPNELVQERNLERNLFVPCLAPTPSGIEAILRNHMHACPTGLHIAELSPRSKLWKDKQRITYVCPFLPSSPLSTAHCSRKVHLTPDPPWITLPLPP